MTEERMEEMEEEATGTTGIKAEEIDVEGGLTRFLFCVHHLCGHSLK